MKNICPSCGEKLSEDNVKYCPNCGSPIDYKTKQSQMTMKIFQCQNCGKILSNKPNFCPTCGCPSEMFVETDSENIEVPEIKTPSAEQNARPIVINNVQQQEHNGIGTIGCVMSIIALFLSWVPGVGWILWILGALSSFIGLFKSPRGLAIAGSIISIFGFLMLLLFLLIV